MRRRILDHWPTVLFVLAMLAARSSLADHYVVPSGSMEPTLLPGDRVLVDKTAYGLRIPFTTWEIGEDAEPRRGDVAIFDSPEDGTRLIKRVVAVAGDEVSLRDGHLTINGRSLSATDAPDVERASGLAWSLALGQGGGLDIAPTKVPSGHVLVLGDARGNSRDSRYFGFVHTDTLYGRALRVFFRSEQGPAWLRLSPAA